VLVSLAAAVAIGAMAPTSAAAQDYDIDCKLLLCLPAGFPGGCRDAFDHMVDRLRDGKSPIGFCAMSDGTEYDAYDVDYGIVSASSRSGWECSPGKTLYHTTRRDDEDTVVRNFCYDNAYRHGWGEGARTRYTNTMPPARTDFAVKLTVEPGTPVAYSPGWQTFDAGIARDWRTRVQHRP
jgi:hypothetical protein